MKVQKGELNCGLTWLLFLLVLAVAGTIHTSELCIHVSSVEIDGVVRLLLSMI
jgi:hypothetical protein